MFSWAPDCFDKLSLSALDGWYERAIKALQLSAIVLRGGDIDG